jgi:hypothetical protein
MLEPSARLHDGLLTVVPKVRDASSLHFLSGQETEIVHSVIERDIDDPIAELGGTRNESGGIECRSIPNREFTLVDPDDYWKFSRSKSSSRTEHVKIET